MKSTGNCFPLEYRIPTLSGLFVGYVIIDIMRKTQVLKEHTGSSLKDIMILLCINLKKMRWIKSKQNKTKQKNPGNLYTSIRETRKKDKSLVTSSKQITQSYHIQERIQRAVGEISKLKYNFCLCVATMWWERKAMWMQRPLKIENLMSYEWCPFCFKKGLCQFRKLHIISKNLKCMKIN